MYAYSALGRPKGNRRLKLATPIAFKFGMYGAGTSGILVKSADALERLSEATTFVFDKTGTLTTGSLEVAMQSPLIRASVLTT